MEVCTTIVLSHALNGRSKSYITRFLNTFKKESLMISLASSSSDEYRVAMLLAYGKYIPNSMRWASSRPFRQAATISSRFSSLKVVRFFENKFGLIDVIISLTLRSAQGLPLPVNGYFESKNLELNGCMYI